MRIKRVFSSHSEVCHIWAQQKQSEGRSGNIFFRDTTDIYSYGLHYLAAKIHTVKGKRFALVRYDSASVSTSGHLSDIRSALNGLMPYFQVNGTDAIKNPKLAVKDLDQRAKESLESVFRKVKVESIRDLDWILSRVRGAYDRANALRGLLGMTKIKPNAKRLKEATKHLEFRIERYKALNTPEMIAKREAEREKREAKRLADAMAKQAEDLERWHRGESVWRRFDLPTQQIRIVDDRVETTSGARVGLTHAKRLLAAIDSGLDVTGREIGPYTVNEVSGDIVRIGCHRISLTHARQILGQGLRLVEVSNA